MNTAPVTPAPSPSANDDAPANDAPANGCEPPRLVRSRSLYALAGEAGPRRPRIRRGEGDAGALVSDADLDLLAAAEHAFRREWARELGIDPARADLYALPPVAPAADLADTGV